MRINHNISSMTAQGSMFRVNRDTNKSIEKLSTGLRINSAADDAAGLGVSENLRTQVRGLTQASKNTEDAIALLNIADGALGEQTEILQRMRELVIQGKNDTYTYVERGYMGDEFKALYRELDRIAQVTNYNGMRLFDSSPTENNANSSPRRAEDSPNIWQNPADGIFGAGDDGGSHHFNMMIGGNYTQADENAFNGPAMMDSYEKSSENMITIQLGQMDATSLFSTSVNGLNAGDYLFGDAISAEWNPFSFDQSVSPFDNMFSSFSEKMNCVLNVIDGNSFTPTGPFGDLGYFGGTNPTGLERINTMRSYIGAMTNRLQHNLSNLQTSITNQQSAESLIRDADFAVESATFTKNSILSQSATSMLAQANVVPQSVLSLIGG
ncbi:MAG TPA: flagellin [Chitinispirillaceae bacterium]|nr:flagellin [Chitinispirillaceae bacterium]